MSQPDPESPQAFRRNIRLTLLKGFAIPVAVLVFFALAPAWLNHNLHSAVESSIAQSRLSPTERQERLASFAKIDFAEVCRAPAPGWERLRDDLTQNGIAGQFQRLRWGCWLSVALVALLGAVTLATFALNRRAQRSRDDLIAAYRLAWRLSVAAALAKVLLLIPLLAYGSFELTTLATERYLPKLILVIVIGGLVALWRSAQVLLRPVPLEFSASMARALTAAEAPILWDTVRTAAARMGTTPPDHILVGMEPNFYVTELAVNHRRGRAAGRTLYLSLPLLQQLSPDEVLAIIGHELGHFRGDDTRITREFYPLRLKAGATLQALAASGWVGWTSVHALLFFHNSFAETEQAVSREREFVADRVAADLTSPRVMAAALTKVHVFTEALTRRLRWQSETPFAGSLVPFVRAELVAQTAFWTKLFEKQSPHPLDSHPSLRLRLEALGESADPEIAKTLTTTETATAYDRWLAGRDELFAEIQAEALGIAQKVRTATADYETPDGRQLLDQQFPEISWPVRAFSMWIKIAFCSLGTAISAILIFAIDGAGLKLLMAAFLAICAWPITMLWRRHRDGRFTLRADSLAYTGWVRPLRFADIAGISAQSQFGAITVTFTLKTRAPVIWKHSPLGRISVRTVQLDLGLIRGKSKETYATLVRYLSRQSADAT